MTTETKHGDGMMRTAVSLAFTWDPALDCKHRMVSTLLTLIRSVWRVVMLSLRDGEPEAQEDYTTWLKVPKPLQCV